MMARMLALTCITLAVASCGSDPAPPAPAGPQTPADTGPTKPVPGVEPAENATQGEKFFIDTLHPVLLNRCGLCHARGAQSAPIWLDAAADKAYVIIKEFKGGEMHEPPPGNAMLNKGEHVGPDLEPDEEGLVKRWVSLEHPESVGGGQGVDLEDLMEKYETCGLEDDAFNDWIGQQLDTLPQTLTNGNCSCTTCHADQDKIFGVFLSDDARQTFDAHSVQPSVNTYVLTDIDQNGTLIGLRPSDRLVTKGQEEVACDCNIALGLNNDFLDPDFCHPDYDLDDDLEDNLDDFIRLMLSRTKTADCSIP